MAECRQAVIVAAGRGSRLAPLTDDRPKCLVDLGGSALIDSLLGRLREVGVVEVVVVTGYRSADVRKHLAGRDGMRVDVVENSNWARCQNSVSLHLAADRVQPPFLLLDGDLWLSARLADSLRAPDRMAVAPLAREMMGTRARVEAGQVVALGSQGNRKTVNAASFSAVWWHDWFRPALARLIAAGRTGEFYESAIADALRGGAPPLAEVMAGAREWFEIDTAADLAAARTHLAPVRAA